MRSGTDSPIWPLPQLAICAKVGIMAQMLLSLLYLAVNITCTGVLLSAKYYRMWALLCVQLAVTCWQICVLLFVPVTDRTMAIRYWLPGDIVLVAVTAAAVLEVLWRAMDRFHTRHRVGVCLWILATVAFAIPSIRWLLGLQAHAEWYEQIKADRMIWNLCIAVVALIAAGVAHTFNRTNDPRFVRFHGTLIAGLAVGHVLLADVAHWSQSRTVYRGWELVCCFGWCINANLSGKEALWLAKVEERVRPALILPVANLQQPEVCLPPARGGFGGRRWGAGAGVLQPESHAQTSLT